MMSEFDEFESLFDDEPEDEIEDEKIKIPPGPEDHQVEVKKRIEKKPKSKRKSPIKQKPKILTVNSISEDIIKFTEGKQAKAYERTHKILTSHDKNRNYQSNIVRDVLEILIEMGRLE
ncbi:MAG: hypothetical protein ACOC1X_01930 [Promethearchaeota archaeon]